MIEAAREVVLREAAALRLLGTSIDESFAHAVRLVENRRGRVVTTGLGKSGLVAARTAAILSSTGTPGVYVHSGDALHGDAGAILPDDVLIAFSHSGETTEICALVDIVQARGVCVVALTGNSRSALAGKADLVLGLAAHAEADPLGLVPSCSSASASALGDALAIVLMRRRGITRCDFAVNHPGGKLGRLAREADRTQSASVAPSG